VIELGKPFKDREEVKTDIRLCDKPSIIIMLASFIFAALGVIVDAFDMALGLESMSWFLLAIVAIIAAIYPYLNYVMARNLYGIESELKSE